MLASMFVSPAALVIFSLCDMSPVHYNVRKERFILAPGFEGFCHYMGEGCGRADYTPGVAKKSLVRFLPFSVY